LSYYITLSCNSWGICALLYGAFFNPIIDCNVVSTWLEPIFRVIDPIIKRGDYRTFTTVMVKGQLILAPL
ncbi:hypothetical protein V2W45_1251678, partial [Cenococcum geophilum]